MEDKFEHYCLLGMTIGAVLFIATVLFTIGCVTGFALSEWLGFNGRLMDCITFISGVFGLAGLYPSIKFLTWIGKFLE